MICSRNGSCLTRTRTSTSTTAAAADAATTTNSYKSGVNLFLEAGRPTSLSADLGFYHGFFLFFVSYPPSSLNGTQPNRATCSEVSAIWKCMSEVWGVPSPWKSGAKNTFFRRFCNLAATLTACISRTKHDIHNRASALPDCACLLQGVSYIVSKQREL